MKRLGCEVWANGRRLRGVDDYLRFASLGTVYSTTVVAEELQHLIGTPVFPVVL